MKAQLISLKSPLTAALVLAAASFAHSQTAPLRSHAISGVENAASYSPTSGWTYATNHFTGTLDMLSSTNAMLTKVYADGTSVSRELILAWYFDLAAPTQGGTAVEVPDPADPLIKRTIWNLGLQFDGLRDVDMAFQRTVDETIDRVLTEWEFPTVRLDRERRESWANYSLDAILPLLGPVQQPLFEEGSKV